jgi:ABC-2 type transport system ATP-binding protein
MINVISLTKAFSGEAFKRPKRVITEISFDLPEHSCTGFVGANGSGKTTTLKCMLGFLIPDQGQVLYWGKPLSADVKKRIGYLPERPYLYEFLTAHEFLKLHWSFANAKFTKNDFIIQRDAILKEVGLENAVDKKIRNFSKGMMQRLGLAQALINKPDLLILDEPMSGLDPDGRWLVKEILKKEKAKGTTLFFSSHLLSDMQELCENLVAMDRGEVIFTGSTRSFIEKVGRPERPDLEEAFINAQRIHRGGNK